MKPLPYGRQWIGPEDEQAVAAALRDEWLTQGPGVERFEEALAEAVGARYAVAVSSGTAALHLGCLALGLGPGDVALTSPITFVASANAAVYCGARPAFADVDPSTACLDPDALEEALRGGLRPKLVIPVHYAGLPCDLERLAELGERFGFALLEDACHALGASHVVRGERGPVGACRASAAAVLSFHPVKHITTGEGGAVVTNDSRLAEAVRRLRSHGIERAAFQVPEQARGAHGEERPWYYEMQDVGYNYRVTDLQCALGRSQLRRLPAFLARRRELASRYRDRLAGPARAGLLRLPVEAPGRESAWHLFPVRIPLRRDEVYLELRRSGVGTQVHYLPVHLQPYYRRRFGTGPGQYPHAEAFFEETLSLPLFAAMEPEDVERVSSALEAVLRRERPAAASASPTSACHPEDLSRY